MAFFQFNRTPRQWEEPDIRSASLKEVLVQSDYLTVHCPLTPDTKYLINKDTLKLMKPTSFIINTARGQIINEHDLIEALRGGIIAGAALDVQEQETPELDNPLFEMTNVILTPHIGWKCLESRQRLLGIIADNINAFIQEKLINVVQ